MATIVWVVQLVANLLNLEVAFLRKAIRCVLQLEIRGMPALAIDPILND